MKFCTICENKYYIRISDDDENKLSHYCRNCGNVESADGEEQGKICVMETQLSSSEQAFNYSINEYTKFDPTLPRLYTMKCPNLECLTNKTTTGQTEIIYMRYNDDQLKYAYICVECDTTWKTE